MCCRCAFSLPVLFLTTKRGGSIIPRRMRVRRSSYTMRRDPYTLMVALSNVRLALILDLCAVLMT